jgi:hypothetical protein
MGASISSRTNYIRQTESGIWENSTPNAMIVSSINVL